MTINTYTEYLRRRAVASDEYTAARDVLIQEHKSCRTLAEQARDLVLGNPSSTPAQQAAALAAFDTEVRRCDVVYQERQRQLDATHAAEVVDIERQAREGLARLSRLIVSWEDLLPAAADLQSVSWMSNAPTDDIAPVLTVADLGQLRQTLEYDRFANELLLMSRVEGDSFLLAGERAPVPTIVGEWGPGVRTQVGDALYLRGERTGEDTFVADPLRTLLQAGTVHVDWTTAQPAGSQRICFPPSMFIGPQAASGFGMIAERLIEQDYCARLGCGPTTDYFDKLNPTEWKDFLIRHDPSLGVPPKSTLIGGAGWVGIRPDICTNNGVRREYYEIKPFSPSGVTEGMIKLVGLMQLLNYLGQPYVPGVTYGDVTLPLMSGTVLGFQLAASLEVTRPLPGLVLYRLCIEGELEQILVKVAMAVLVAWLLAQLSSLLEAIPVVVLL